MKTVEYAVNRKRVQRLMRLMGLAGMAGLGTLTVVDAATNTIVRTVSNLVGRMA